MGGLGSTRWGLHTRKQTVEECLQLDVFRLDWQGVIEAGKSGIIRWGKSSMDFCVTAFGSGEFQLRVSYCRVRGDQKVIVEEAIQVTTEGSRVWFVCPLQGCDRRVRKLYLPPGDRYFACRHCHYLTYLSCQSSRKELTDE